MAFNQSASYYDLPPLPSYTVKPLPDLLPWISDTLLSLLLPVIAYWAVSMVFHLIDVYDLFPQYRLHTPAELLTRNHVSRWDVFKDVLIQQAIQTTFGYAISYLDPVAMYGKEEYDVAVWARRARIAQHAVPFVLGFVGLDSAEMAKNWAASNPMLAGFLAGGQYPSLQQMVSVNGQLVAAPAFATWELLVAKAIYYFVIPAFQFILGILMVDTWQYFMHRFMHINKFLYTAYHSRHHRLYVPYAYGALYNHPVEGFFMDTLGTGLAYLVTGMTCRQSMWFFTCATIKTVDDHCGYALPLDPLQHITSNNAGYHDIHHQSWGIKTNFSQPFFTFWDRFLGTMWVGGDISARYARTKLAAERKVNSSISGSQPSDSTAATSPDPYEEPDHLAANELFKLPPKTRKGKATAQAVESRKQVLDDKENGGAQIIAEEVAEEQRAQSMLKKRPRKKSSVSSEVSLKGLKDRVSGSFPSGVPRVESRR
ncbi:C4-hydroxylase [Tothia fuscella]|uniref:C4-hydroxylase n=1 Tax=Tothia fuscella TaxID=1048955 RepID=A0A9P4NTW9_9PEZI|nr:C4-hydroxylase [Tothia fuscella]